MLCRRVSRIRKPARLHASEMFRWENQEILYPRRASSFREVKCADNACAEMSLSVVCKIIRPPAVSIDLKYGSKMSSRPVCAINPKQRIRSKCEIRWL